MTKVILLIRNDFYRLGIAAILKESCRYYSITLMSTWQQVNERIQESCYDLIIADIFLSHQQATSHLDNLSKTLPDLKTVFLVDEDDEMIAITCIKNGADGLIPRDIRITEFNSALSLILEGKSFVFERIRNLMIEDAYNQGKALSLTKREFQIAQLLIKGKRTIDIGVELSLSPSTVSTMKTKIYKKMNVANVLDLHAKIPIVL